MYMRTRYFIAGILLLALFAGCSSDSGEGDAPGGGSGDLYGYVRDASGSAIEGVVVSDGYTCTVTGADGRYAMQRHPNAYYVYYSTPADCKVEVDPSTGLPLFYQKIRKSQPQYDFTLTRQAEETKFRMLAIGDPQVTTTAQVYRFETETVADINSYVAAQTDGLPTYAITLGDIVGNKWELYPDMVKAMARSKTSVPVFQTIGNHDHEFPQVTDLSAQRRYEASFGPVNYSFTRGDVHFVSMDDIIHKATGSDAYTSGFLDWQFEWLKQDLSYVPRTCAVVLCVHIPFRGGFNGAGETYFDEVLELLLDLDATPEQLDSPMLFCSGRQGTASYSPDVVGTDLTPLFETILEYIPAPEADVDQPFQMLVSSIDYNEFVGRIAVGRIERGTLKQNQEIMVCNYHDPDATPKKAKAVSIYEFEGLARKQVTESTAGNIIAMSGIPDITIGDTVCAPGAVEPLPFVKISAPTLEMTFSVNDSPYAGREGKFVTSRQLRDRLYRETLKDVSLKVSDTDRDSAFNVAGRGEMSLSILIETMRREGYEFQVSPPRVLYKEIDGKKCEPIERLVVDVPGDCVGSVIEKLGQRKGDLVEMTPVGDRMKVEFLIPARGLFGYRNDFLTDTKGEGIMASVFDSYAPYKGDISRRGMGSLISTETGDSITYGLFNAQERGTLFIGAGVPVYEGMIIGVANRGEDIVVNACRKKQLTNTRASGSDDALRLVPPRQMSLEQCLEFLADDELLEVTPKSLRMRKAILNHEQRMKSLKGKK